MKLQTQTKKLLYVTCLLYLRSVSTVQKHKFISKVTCFYCLDSSSLYGIRFALCWYLTQSRIVVWYRHSEQHISLIFKGQKFQNHYRTDRFSRNVGKNTFLRYVKSQKKADPIYNAAGAGSQAVFSGVFISDNRECPEKPLTFQQQSVKVAERRLV